MTYLGSVLFVTDEPAFAGSIVRVLRREVQTVDIEDQYLTGLRRAVRESHDLVVLDMTGAELDGASLCQQIRHSGVTVPILVLTTQTGESDVVVVLDAGADDYVTKPFRVAELLARVRALLRRYDQPQQDYERPITMNRSARLAYLNGHELCLTAKEFDLLAVLLREQGNVVTRKVLVEALWGDDRRTKPLDIYISNLRRRLDDDAGQPHFIVTVRGVGFRLHNEKQSVQPRTPT